MTFIHAYIYTFTVFPLYWIFVSLLCATKLYPSKITGLASFFEQWYYWLSLWRQIPLEWFPVLILLFIIGVALARVTYGHGEFSPRDKEYYVNIDIEPLTGEER